MAADYLYGAFVVINAATGQLLQNQTGHLETPDGTPTPVYDVTGTPIIGLQTSELGVCAPFRADVSDAVPVFGSVKLPQRSTEQFILESDLVAAKSQAEAAQLAAESAETQAGVSAASAQAAAQAAQDAANLVDSNVGGVIDAFLDQSGGVYDRLDDLEQGGGGGGVGFGNFVAVRANGDGHWPTSWDGIVPSYSGGSTTAGVRPTDDPNVCCQWIGGQDSPPVVASGTGGMHVGDLRTIIV